MKGTTRLAAAIIPVAVILAAAPLFAQHVEIRLQGRYYAEPATVHIIVAVEPDATNRVLRIEADGEQMFRSSELSMTEDAGRRLYTVEFRNLAAGNYIVRAEVLSSTRKVAVAEQPLVVASPVQ